MKHSAATIALRASTKTLWIIVMTVFGFVFAYPFIYGLLASLMLQKEYGFQGSMLAIPTAPTLQNYAKFMTLNNAGAIGPFFNSVGRAAWATFVVCSVSVLVGYPLARYEFKIKKAVIIGIVAAQVIPGVLTMIPSFLLVSRIPFVGGNNWAGFGGRGLINNKLMLFLPLGWGVLLWAFLFMQAIKGFPRSFEEAAEIDGYGFWSILLKIVLPMQGPILAVIAINTALGSWNDWLTPFLYINRPGDSTLAGWLGTLIANLGRSGIPDYPRVYALGTLTIIPPFVIFLIFQKHIIQGISSVGIKG
ncbi:ABC transporter [Spirochaetia bacterium]|nr:ABC transporter [Spirochaetia bacterium]